MDPEHSVGCGLIIGFRNAMPIPTAMSDQPV